MKKHLKRQKVPKSWPIPRKGTKYVVRPNFGLNKGVPLLIALRDMLKICKNRKEIKKAIYEKKIRVNNKVSKDEKDAIQLFDRINLADSKKYYKLNLSEKSKFFLEEIDEKKGEQKVAKIINKKILKGKRTQLNLSDGRNFISSIKCRVNDSVLIDLKNRTIKKSLPLEKNAKIIVVAGKHAGKRGTLIGLKVERKMAELKIGDKKMNILIKHIMVTE